MKKVLITAKGIETGVNDVPEINNEINRIANSVVTKEVVCSFSADIDHDIGKDVSDIVIFCPATAIPDRNCFGDARRGFFARYETIYIDTPIGVVAEEVYKRVSEW